MNRLAKIVCCSLLLAPAVAIPAPGANAANGAAAPRTETVIYKHVDENGRVTYANSPIKGGARVELEPLTVIPSTPSGSLNAANAQFTATPVAAMRTATVTVPTSSTPANNLSKPPVQVATVVPVSASYNKAQTVPASPAAAPVTTAPAIAATVTAAPTAAAPENNVVASLDTMNQLTQQRRAETRKRLLEGELQTEEKLLVSAKARLEEEQKLSGSIRAMRSSFAATAEAVTAQKPLISPETRAEIERHFERVRNLQDQVAMHENHLQTLRGQLTDLK